MARSHISAGWRLTFLAVFLPLAGCNTIPELAEGDVLLARHAPIDFVRARECFRLGAEKGDAVSRSKYAAMCLAGLGGPVDAPAALDALNAAAAQNEPRALMLLADLYSRGEESIGLEKDLERSAKYVAAVSAKMRPAAADLAKRIERLRQGGPAVIMTRQVPKRPASVDGPPEWIERCEPPYPVALQMLGLQAEVVVDLRVLTDGTVAQVHVVNPTLPQFDAAAVEAVRQWRFAPGVKNGRPVVTHMQVPITFTVK